MRVRGETLPAVRLEDRRVRHRHERRLADQRPRAREALEACVRAHALRERLLARAADHGSVRERVGERKAELDEVGASVDRCRGQLRRLGSGHEIDH